jgi:putative ABC transport system ATP-binding protein
MSIELYDVWKSFGVDYVLRGVDLVVDEGEFVSIRGRSGVGKTTLIRIMGLLDLPDEGTVKLLGVDVGELDDSGRSRLRLGNIGIVFQFFNLIPSLTALENVELPMALAGVKRDRRRERALELLKLVGLEDKAYRFPDRLSGGERQRVAIARALANKPKILLADEPISNLDDFTAEEIIRIFRKISEDEGTTVIMTMTDLYEELPTDKDYFLRDGKLQGI